MLTLSDYPVPNPNIIGRILDNEAVLVLPDKGKVKVLNEVGARIWELVDGARSVRDIAAAICAEYDVDVDQAQLDTLAFLDELETKGMVSLKIANDVAI
jgi:hypothetical protein